MNPNSEPSRASEIWKRFAGMFGGDALERQFGKTPPPEWGVMLSRLKPFEIDRGVRRLAYSGKQHVPSLPEFTKLCRQVADDDMDEGPQRIALPNPDAFEGDGWDIAGNMRLLQHITTVVSANSKILGEVWPCKEIKHPVTGQRLHLASQASHQQTASTAILVGYKKAWSTDMREYVNTETGEVGKPPMGYQDATWKDGIRRAMAEIQSGLTR